MSPIVDIYRRTIKPRDQPWNTYVCRPIAAVFVYWLSATRVTPNQVTLASAAVAFGAAVCLGLWPSSAGLIVAIAIYQFSYVLDCVDGMLARHRGIQSTRGHLLDFLMDELKAFLVLAAVTYHWYERTGDPRRLLWGLGGLVCLASGIAMTTFLRRPEISGASADFKPTLQTPALGVRWLLSRAEMVGRFLVHYPSYIWIAAATDCIELYVYPYVAANALYVCRAGATIVARFGRA